MKIIIVCVGKKHDPTLIDAIAEYEKRLSTYCDLSWEILPAGTIDEESKAIVSRVEGVDFVVLLDETGMSVTSEQLAHSMEVAQNRSYKKVALIIGGAYGVNKEVFRRADVTLRLSSLTFPHQLVRLIVVEQLYRAFSILAGSNYHHR